MKRLPALLTMTAVSVVIAVGWLLTVDVWCDSAGLRKHPSGVLFAASRPTGPDRAASRRIRAAKSRPTSRRGAPVDPHEWAADGTAGYLIGRVVSQWEPVARANVQLALVDAEGSSRQVYDVADFEGRFALAIPDAPFVSATFEAESPRGSGFRMVNVPPPYRGTKDVGDFALADFRTIWFSVLSPKGDPIERANVTCQGKRGAEQTGPEGTGSIEVGPGVQTLKVTAFGYEDADVPVPVGDDSVTVRPRPVTTLVVHVTTPAGDPPAQRLRICVESETTPFEVLPRDPAWKAIGNTTPDHPDDRMLFFGYTRTVRLSRVRAGAKLTVTASDLSAAELARRAVVEDRETRQVVTLAAGEHKNLDIVLRGEWRRMCGKVVGPRGRPVKDAAVQLERRSPG